MYNQIINLLCDYRDGTGLSLEESPLADAELLSAPELRALWKAYDHASGLVPSEHRTPLLRYSHLALACLHLADAIGQSEEQKNIAEMYAAAELKLAIRYK